MQTSELNYPPCKVSVMMITYNHEKYIEDAVRSVMMQKTDFEFELVLSEDCSTDRTLEIAAQLKREFPDKIRLISNKTNIGMIANMITAYNACIGDFVAVCEGDDYWTSPYKLQNQVDYIEAHPECGFCFHSSKILNPDDENYTRIIPLPGMLQTGPINIQSWLEHLYIPTATVIFKHPKKQLPSWYQLLKNAGDWPLFLWLVHLHYQIHFMDTGTPWAVYRIHSGGISSPSRKQGTYQQQQRLLKGLKDVKLVSKYLDIDISIRYFSLHRLLCKSYLHSNDLKKARYHYLRSMRHISSCNRIGLSLLLQCFFPRAYRLFKRIRHTLNQDIASGLQKL